jgi:GST-like protein
MTITLHAAPMSSATAVHTALLDLDVPHQLVWVDLTAGEQRTPAHLALNPNGKVPVLVVDGTPMFESLAIMQWLGDRFGVERGLWPASDAPERLTALSWSTWAYVTYGTALTRFIYADGNVEATSNHLAAELRHPALAAQMRMDLQTLLGLLDEHLAARDFMLGETYSLADLIVGCVVTYSTFCGVSVDAHPHVQGWLARFHARPAYQQIWGASAP